MYSLILTLTILFFGNVTSSHVGGGWGTNPNYYEDSIFFGVVRDCDDCYIMVKLNSFGDQSTTGFMKDAISKIRKPTANKLEYIYNDLFFPYYYNDFSTICFSDTKQHIIKEKFDDIADKWNFTSALILEFSSATKITLQYLILFLCVFGSQLFLVLYR